METKFCSPYEISFYEGFFVLIINIILLIIISNFEVSEHSGILKVFKHSKYREKIFLDNWNYYIDKFDGKEFFVFCLAAINRVLYNLFSLLTIKYFTPSHVIIILLFGEMEYGFETVKRGNIAFVVFFFILLFFLILVFTEIIELNFCGLSENTKKNIKKRAIKAEYSDEKNERYSSEYIEMDGVLINVSEEEYDE